MINIYYCDAFNDTVYQIHAPVELLSCFSRKLIDTFVLNGRTTEIKIPINFAMASQ